MNGLQDKKRENKLSYEVKLTLNFHKLDINNIYKSRESYKNKLRCKSLNLKQLFKNKNKIDKFNWEYNNKDLIY
jgi:hypothetical protein